MSEFGKMAATALQVLADAVEQEAVRRGDHGGKQAEQSPLAGQVTAWMEQFAGAPLWERRKELGLQLRAEMMELLRSMEPQFATALLCQLPSAARRGYTPERLAASLGVTAEQIQAWEDEAYARLGELVTERTPFLAFLQMRAGEGASGQGSRAFADLDAVGKREGAVWSADAVADGGTALKALVQLAQVKADFDLRKFVGAALELQIRQAFHRFGVDALEQVTSLFAKEDQAAVALVGSRMKLEMGGEEDIRHG